MKIHKQSLAFLVAIALIVGFSSTAFGIEAFQERFEWGDMSKDTTIQGRVITVDPYDKAVWLNVAIYGGNSESGLWWQKMHPGKNLKFYAKDDAIWNKLKDMGRSGVGPAAAKSVPASSKGTLVEIVATEPEQNKRVISSVKKIDEVAGTPDKPVSIAALKATDGKCKDETAGECFKAKQKLATAPKALPRMQYDVMLPGGKPIGGLIKGSAPYNSP